MGHTVDEHPAALAPPVRALVSLLRDAIAFCYSGDMRVRGAVVVLCLSWGVAAADADLELIVTTGDTLPGLTDPVADLVTYTAISGSGEVVFPAFATVDSSGLYRWSSGSTPTLIGTTGSTVAGLMGTFPFVNGYDFFVDASGRVLLSTDQAEIYRQPRTGAPELLIDQNTVCPDGTGNLMGTYAEGGIRLWSSDGNKLAFGSLCGGVVVGSSSFIEYLDGVPPGYGAEWTTSGNIPSAAAPNGDVAVVAYSYCADPPGPCSVFEHYALYRIRTGTATRILARGDTVTGAPGPVWDFREVSTSADGGMAAIVEFEDGAGGYVFGAVHVDNAGTVRLVTKVGDTIAGLSITGIGYISTRGAIVALTGNRVGLRLATDGSFTYNTMLRWSASSGTLERVWTHGTAAFTLPGTDISMNYVQRQLITPSGRLVLYVEGTSASRPMSTGFLVREQTDGEFEVVLSDKTMVDVAGLPAPFAITSFDVPDGQGISSNGYLSVIDDNGSFVVYLYNYVDQNNFVKALAFVGGSLVVNSQDDDALAGGATSCTTGQILANGAPECTLRAALQLANARSRESIITFALPNSNPIVATTQLPTITVPLTIDGSSEGRVRLNASVSGTIGLRTTAALTVKNLDVGGFGVGGIRADSTDTLHVSTSEIADNAGYGIANFEGSVTLENVSVLRNGEMGVLMMGAPLLDRDLVVTNSTIADNDEAGLVAKGYIQLRGVTITGNGGPGAVVGEGGAFRRGITILFHDVPTTISSNKGDGLRTEYGGIEIQDKAIIEGNVGWGVRAGERVTIGDELSSGMRSIVVNGNGGGTMCTSYDLVDVTPLLVDVPCGGGGVLSLLRNLDDTNRITDLVAHDNDGPGVLANSGITLTHVDIRRNAGVGAGVTYAGPDVRGLHLYGVLPSYIMENEGDGLWYNPESGSVSVMAATIANNGDWGIWSTRTVNVGMQDDLTPVWERAQISGNGRTPTCFNYVPVDNEIMTTTRPTCVPGGGIFAEYEGFGNNINRIYDVLIQYNDGPGIFAMDTVMLSATEIEGNGGAGVVVASDERGYASTLISTHLRPVKISNNQGDGLVAFSGNIAVGAPIEVMYNGGRGIAADYGDVELTPEPPGFGFTTKIHANGNGDCREYGYMAGPILLDTPCKERAGVFAERDVDGENVEVIGNYGPGIVSLDGAVRLKYTTFCRNRGDNVVANTKQLSSITDCGIDDNDSCLSAGRGHRPPWLLALVLLFVLRRRR